MPIDLALEMFIETGDLPVAKYPALEELAEIIAQVLNVGDEIRSFAPFGSNSLWCREAKIITKRSTMSKKVSLTRVCG